VENGLVDLSQEAHLPKGLYIARTLVRDRQEVPVRFVIFTCDQKFTKGSPLAHCEVVTLVTPPSLEKPQV
jgi:hypothetical protein